MDKNLSESQIVRTRKVRRDAGGKHRSKKYKDMVLRRYLMNGEFAGEWSSIEDAVEAGGGRFTYIGIYNVIRGIQFQHGGFLWRSNKGFGRGLLEGCEEVKDVKYEAAGWLNGLAGRVKRVVVEVEYEGGGRESREFGYRQENNGNDNNIEI